MLVINNNLSGFHSLYTVAYIFHVYDLHDSYGKSVQILRSQFCFEFSLNMIISINYYNIDFINIFKQQTRFGVPNCRQLFIQLLPTIWNSNLEGAKNSKNIHFFESKN